MKILIKTILITLFYGYFIVPVRAQKSQSIPYGNNPARGKYLDIQGFKMYYEVYGTVFSFF